MSVDLIGTGTPPAPKSVGLVSDTVVIFGGWGDLDGGEPLPHRCVREEHRNLGGHLAGGPALPAAHDTDTADLVHKIEEMTRTAPVLHQTQILAIQGSIGSAAVTRGYEFIRSHFHPQGRIVIYGYSMGGYDALCLCNKIQVEMPLYDYASGETKRPLSLNDGLTALMLQKFFPPPKQILGKVRVDLLITVDAAFGPVSKVGAVTQMRVVAPCVRRNLNYYQTTEKGRAKSRGGPNTAIDPLQTSVENDDRTPSSDHASIDKHTKQEVIDAIEESLTGLAAQCPLVPAQR